MWNVFIDSFSLSQQIVDAVVQSLSCVWFMDCSTPGFPNLHHLPELTQTHVHWVGDAIQPYVIPFSSCLQSFPVSGSFPLSWLLASGDQSTGASPSASVLPINIQDWFPLGLTSLISLQSKGLSTVFSSTTIWKHQFFSSQPSLWSNSHIHSMTTGKTIALTIRTFVSKVMSLPLNMLSKFVTAFLSRSKRLFSSWLQSLSVMILEPKKQNLDSNIVSYYISSSLIIKVQPSLMDSNV